MNVLPGFPPSRAERPTTAILHDESSVRVVAFHLLPGQRIPPHDNGSTVTVHVVEGRGTFAGDEGGVVLGPGGTAVYRPRETRAIDDDAGEALRFLAFLTPAPG